MCLDLDIMAKLKERIASDGLVEKLVELKNKVPKWVPVVPNGLAMQHLTLMQWCFFQL